MSPWVSREQLDAMHEAATADHAAEEAHERAWGYQAGQADGHDQGRSEALGEVARETAREKRTMQQGVENMAYVGRRWARPDQEFGARETFGHQAPGDYPGRQREAEAEREAG